MTKQNIEAFEAAVEAHKEALRLEPEEGPAEGVYHLLRSMCEYCDDKGLDLDELLHEVRTDFVSEAGFTP